MYYGFSISGKTSLKNAKYVGLCTIIHKLIGYIPFTNIGCRIMTIFNGARGALTCATFVLLYILVSLSKLSIAVGGFEFACFFH